MTRWHREHNCPTEMVLLNKGLEISENSDVQDLDGVSAPLGSGEGCLHSHYLALTVRHYCPDGAARSVQGRATVAPELQQQQQQHKDVVLREFS